MTDWTTTPLTADLVRGAAEQEVTARGVQPHRLPAWARAQADDPQVAMVEAQPSGVRVAFRTSATTVELDTLRTRLAYAGAPPRPEGQYDLVVDGVVVDQRAGSGGHTLLIDMATGSVQRQEGPVGTVRFDGLAAGEKDVEIWLPHNELTELVAMRTDAPVRPLDRGDRRVWLHHGSSISHGSNASRPTGTWPAVAARAGGVELVNLGLGGSAMLDPFTARTMRDTPADLVSLKIGINLVNTDLMRMRAFTAAVHGFLDTVRDGHPDTPLLVVSPILCPIHEETPGPSAADYSRLAEGVLGYVAAGDPAEVAAGKLTLGTIRTELARIVGQRRASDPHLHLLDGRELYGEADHAELPLPDALHPDAETHLRMGERFAARAFGDGGPFSR